MIDNEAEEGGVVELEESTAGGIEEVEGGVMELSRRVGTETGDEDSWGRKKIIINQNKPPLKRGKVGRHFLMRETQKGYSHCTPIKWCFV